MADTHQVVRTTRNIPEQGINKGTTGTIIVVFDTPKPAFEIEFTDDKGRTIIQATLTTDDFEILSGTDDKEPTQPDSKSPIQN